MTDRTLPPLRLLTVFEAVFRAGTVQKAASDLNVTQPAVSQALKALEDHVGIALFDRRTRPAALTEAGRVLYAAVAEGLGRIADAIQEIRAMQSGEESSVTIACSVGTATYWLMPRLADFYNAHPEIAVNVMTTLHGVPGFAAGIDMVIRYGLGDWQDGAVTKLFDEKVVPVCSPELAERLGEAPNLEEAVLLHVVGTEKAWMGWREFFARRGQAESRAPGRNFSNYVQATQAALAGQGVMLGWQSNVGDLVREGRLVRLDDAPVIPREAFYLVTAERPKQKTARDVLAAWLREVVA
jgi:LysR family transcriptional regulator, glycine cleavage system transcriptional activator